MLDTWTPWIITIVAICVFLYGASKTAMPVLGVLAGPVLAATLTPTTASAFVVPLLIVGDLFALGFYRQHANWRLIFTLIPGVIVGIVLTALMFAFLDPHTMGRIIGVLILISLVLEIWQRRQHASDAEQEKMTNRGAMVFFGALAGMTTMGANAGGTAMTLYLLKMRTPMLAFMGTSAWFFFVVNLVKVPVVLGLGLISVSSLLSSLVFIPMIVIGAFVGVYVFKRMNQQVFNNVALALSGIAAFWLIVHG